MQSSEASHQEMPFEVFVVADARRCVQCGICSFNCPIEIDVRRHAWLGMAVTDRHCLTCGQCVARCPRGVLRFERMPLFQAVEKGPGGK